MGDQDYIEKELHSIHGQNKALSNEIDLEKLYTVVSKSWKWILLIILLTNLAAYLVIRWTKPVFESYSDLKLNVKNDANLLGFSEVNDEANLNNLSGEIELLKSRLFFDKVIQTLDLDISYYSVGNILEDEKYRSPPFKVDYTLHDDWALDRYFTVDIQSDQEYILGFPASSGISDKRCRFNELVNTDYFDVRLTLNSSLEKVEQRQLYSFKINSRRSLRRYIENNLEVEPLNLTANTIRISFRDHNKFKARDLVNAIDTIYLRYTKEEKNKANHQKIEFLDQQLMLTQSKLQDYESYFETFTIRNKTTDVQSDLDNTIKAIAVLDSQHVILEKKLLDLQQLKSEVDVQIGEPERVLQYSGYNEDINTTLSQVEELVNAAGTAEDILQ